LNLLLFNESSIYKCIYIKSHQSYKKMSNQPPYIPVFSYPGGNKIDISTLPTDTNYKWIESLGGQTITGGAPRIGDLRPDGKPAHGGVATQSPTGEWTIEFHNHNQKK
jgi:hypothetical protein